MCSQFWWLDWLHHGFFPKSTPHEVRHFLVCLPCSVSYHHRWALLFAFHYSESDCIWILRIFRTVFVMRTSFTYRSPWPQGAQTGWGLSESSHHLLKGTCEWKRIGGEPDPAQLFISSSGQTPRAEDSMHSGPAAHLLSETGGSGPPSTNSGKNLYGYSTILKKKKKKENITILCVKLKQTKHVMFYYRTADKCLTLFWHYSRDHYFSSITFQNWTR